MLGVIFLSIGLISLHLPYITIVYADNRNDECFAIYKEAMIPPNRVFRNSESNSFLVCKSQCISEGMRCQSFALGISSENGNGTCQLSSERVFESAGRRPRNTIYDPQFNLYQRKENCNDPDKIEMPPKNEDASTMLTIPAEIPGDRPTSTSMITSTDALQITDTNAVQSSASPTQTQSIPNNDMIHPSIKPTSTNPTMPSTDLQDPSSNPTYSNGPITTTNINMNPSNVDNTKMPTVSTTMNQFPPTYGNNDLNTNEIRPPTHPSSIYMNSHKPDYYPYSSQYPNNFLSSNENGLTSNMPTIDYHTTNDFYESTPPITTYGGPYMGNGWNNAYNMNRRQHNGKYPDREGSNSYPGGNYNGNRVPVTVPFIRTYFNPNDYETNAFASAKHRPIDDVNVGNIKFNGDSRPTTENGRPCFRRALAGKRVAPNWIRRTLSCERVEDCQAECGLEKRFSCEGFNYRLDPTGQGQGICELIDIPLADIDIYSSPSRRDENLLYHPDYDYYERDRNACRPSLCKGCSGFVGKPYLPERSPTSGYGDTSHNMNHGNEHSAHTEGTNYRPYSLTSDYNTHPTTYRPIENYKPFLDSRPHHQSSDRFQPPYVNTAIDKYRPPYDFVPYEHRPPPHEDNYDYNRYDISNQFSSSVYRTPSYDLDRYDFVKPPIRHRPPYSNKPDYSPPSFLHSSSIPSDEHYHHRQPPEYLGPYKPEDEISYPTFSYREHDPSQSYLNRDRESQRIYNSPKRTQSQPYVPYSINKEPSSWASYGGSYGGSNHYNQQSNDFWGLSNNFKQNDIHFNYFNLGHGAKNDRNENSVLSYPGSRYDQEKQYEHNKNRNYYGSLWTRRPGQDDCSVKSSEGFRLHKAVVRYMYNVPTVNECEQMCHSESKFRCMTYSYKYAPQTRDNCLLCDRPISHLDYYTDIEPNLDYDIYSMSDDPHMCNQVSSSPSNQNKNTQCFFRAIDLSRFFKSIVRDSLTVRTVAECEMECIKTTKFTCRAFSFRYGQKAPGSIIDNCQLSDWPVIDMDKDQHLVHDTAFDVYERASYGHGCEIHPITDNKHKKLCYLGYGSPAKLLSSAIKKVVSVSSELECKSECIRFRDNTPFKCQSFSYGSQASTYNCEMSNLDQSELKLNIHYAHTNDRDYWLFAWNSFDLTCRDKVATIGGSSRANNDRRMDIFREKDGDSTWTHFTVSGKACRVGSACSRNLITDFYSCEIDGDEIGSWDYCCKSDYPCGYSQGFDYPWCFVGDGPDQWRTCSDRYYPMSASASSNQVSSNQVLSTGSNATNKKKISNISYTTNKRKGGGSISDLYHQQPPRPGGLQNLEDIASARLWPITYLYSSGPPNSTDLSNFVDCNKESC